jgi:hypothetical protein
LFYSVAQHSILVSEKMPGGPEEKLVGLLHDAAEAYTGDVSSPLKSFMRHRSEGNWPYCPYAELQDRITSVIYNKFGITDIPSDVRLYDRAALVFEAEGCMGLSIQKLQEYGFPTDLVGLWEPWDPGELSLPHKCDVEPWVIGTEFLDTFEDLMKACGREELI